MNIFVMNYLCLKVCPAVVGLILIWKGFELCPAHNMHITGKKKKKRRKGTTNAIFTTSLISRIGKASQVYALT